MIGETFVSIARQASKAVSRRSHVDKILQPPSKERKHEHTKPWKEHSIDDDDDVAHEGKEDDSAQDAQVCGQGVVEPSTEQQPQQRRWPAQSSGPADLPPRPQP